MDDLDLLVVGSGVAGLSAAVRAGAERGTRVGVVTRGELSESATRWAQGGVAAALGGDEDSTDLHLADTLAAGAGLCDVDAVRVLVDEGPARVNELIGLGAVFDRDHEGRLLRAREGGHSLPRVVHAGGAATGAEVERALVEAVQATAAAVLESCLAVELVVEAGRCRGVAVVDAGGRRRTMRASHTLLATGGAGQLYAVTTNPDHATGDGLALALRAGVPVADVEFVQFHPTALHDPAVPRPLLSEALRGHGAVVRDARGERFVDELQPRDVVSRAMAARMLEQGVEHLWLDATALERFDERFPTIAASLEATGLDPAKDWLPIAPAAHFLSGGVVTDLDGASGLPGLWACGEVACSGVHGANRLASNSLLEGMVFAPRVVEAILGGKESCDETGAMRAVAAAVERGEALSLDGGGGRRPAAPVLDGGSPAPAGRPWPGTAAPGGAGGAGGTGTGVATAPAGVAASGPAGRNGARAPAGAPAARAPNGPPARRSRRQRLQEAMTLGAGVLRSRDSLAATAGVLDELEAEGHEAGDAEEDGTVGALAVVARAVVLAAAAREETRGAHTRTDFPGRDDERFGRRLVIA